jgi:phosphoribosylaminoimidazolecarboxamide formyltransferase / IMP cyclohydrolase
MSADAKAARCEVKRALISVFKKDGVLELAHELARREVEIVSTGGTAALLRGAGIAVKDVAELTGFPEMMDGRVKTLHPRVHGGLLMRRDVEAHVAAARAHGIAPIDLVVVNLYPFGEVVAKPGVGDDDAIEMIDIGGPSMVRSAAKNHAFVAVLTEPGDYADFMRAFIEQGGTTTLEQRRDLAAKAFRHTAAYDAAIAEHLGSADLLPTTLHAVFTKKHELRYGENPHQRAAVYLEPGPAQPAVAHARMCSGKELSFNNYLDGDAAWACATSFSETACVVIKHKNPCGAAVRQGDLLAAFQAAYEGDPLSAFGGIVAMNRAITPEVARAIATKDKFFEVVVAPGYEGDSLEILQSGAKWGKNVRLLEIPSAAHAPRTVRELRWIRGGMLVEDPDSTAFDLERRIVTQRAPSAAELRDLEFAWTLSRHVTSNAIVFAKGLALVAAGAGQMSRVDSVELAGRKGGERCRGAVMASDAFFPFADGILAAQRSGIGAVIQPGGSVRDAEVTAACDAHDLAMVFTGRRHFRH